ncbi:site-specific DNA-methyltransferase, partial [bacterium]|nr:site-specific DNA-methyltransferase [bacterium]
QEKKQGERTDLTSGQNDQKLNTAEIIAKQNNVTEKTVRRAEKFADGVDKIAEVMPELKNEILSGKSELTSKDVADISRADADKIAEAVEQKLAEKKNKYAQVADKIKASGRVEQAVENENQAESLNIKVGDVIRAVKNKEHLVFCGDCNDEKIFAELKKCDAVVTDPPYGIAYKAPAGSALAARGNYHVLQNDEQDFDPAHLFEISDKIITWGANHYANKLPNSAGWLVWDKRDGEQINYNSDCELAWTNILGSARMFHHKWNGMIKASEHGIKRVHPTQKPVALFVWAMDVCECGNKITDPYCGSGSSIMACDETNRSCIASEIDPAYVAAIINRLKSNGFEVFINEQRI